ncbi:hypothetical protein Acr_21g0002390 [Actinidia rufa]|uniref:Uncharacterized protein n=1 Tax=Actinidia rufa TaxID=165716 RepID=A0A7J0GFP6_9ERIC|nr:hypothetical protein Acr_21g0002390 [Actinidia rufa]
MELNQAQLLVHDDVALARFRRDHEIPNDVLVERPGPNEVASTVRGHGDHILVRTWLIHQTNFGSQLVAKNPDKDLYLNEFVWISGNKEFRPGDDKLWSFPRTNGRINDGFNCHYKVHSKQCKVAIQHVNNNQEPRDVATLLQHGARASLAATSPSTPVAAPELWAPDLSIGELKRRIIIADIAREHDTCLLLAQVVMLPRDVVDLHAEDGVSMCSLTVMQHIQREKKCSDELKRTQRKAVTLDEELRKRDKDLATITKEHVNATGKLTVAHAKLDKSRGEVSKLQRVVQGPVYRRVFDYGWNRAGLFYVRNVAHERLDDFHDGWLACLKELGMPSYHPTWAAMKPPVVFPDPPEPYSPILLSGFDEEEYASRSAEEDEDVVDGGAKVPKAEAEKEQEAGVKAARAEGDLQDNPRDVKCHAAFSDCFYFCLSTFLSLFRLLNALGHPGLGVQVLKRISSFASELSYLVWTIPIGIKLSVCRALGVSNNFPKNKVSNREFYALDLLIVRLDELFLIARHSDECIFASFVGKVEVTSYDLCIVTVVEGIVIRIGPNWPVQPGTEH